MHVQRIPGGALKGRLQPEARRGTEDARTQGGHAVLSEGAEMKRYAAALHREIVQQVQLLPVWQGTRRPHEQQRYLVHGACQPVPRQQARLVGPLQVFEREDDRTLSAQPVDQFQHLLGGRDHRIDRCRAPRPAPQE